MSVVIEWVRFSPKISVRVDITGGSLTLASSSALVNVADYPWNPAQVVASILKNSSVATTVSINSSTGALTSSAVSVATGDAIEVRVEFTGPFSWPWSNRMIASRSAFLTVPSGTSSTEFDDSHNAQPVPGFDLGFGWDANDKLEVGVKVGSADGASQSMTLTTRRGASSDESSSTISLSNTSTAQEHTSVFTKADVTATFDVEWLLKSAAGTPRQEDRVRLQFNKKTLVASYPPGFATDNVSLVQSKSSGKLRLGAPGQ